jgi:hypothetical protein
MCLDFSGQDAGVTEYDQVAEVNVVLSKIVTKTSLD